MRTWIRLAGRRQCGLCGAWFGIGEAMLVLTIGPAAGQGRIAKARCIACAGEPVPDPFPPLPDRTVESLAMQDSLKRLELIFKRKSPEPQDMKSAAIGEREPGCDDV